MNFVFIIVYLFIQRVLLHSNTILLRITALVKMYCKHYLQRNQVCDDKPFLNNNFFYREYYGYEKIVGLNT